MTRDAKKAKNTKNTRQSKRMRDTPVEKAWLKFVDAFQALKNFPPHTEDGKKAHQSWEKNTPCRR